jgi:glycolate oxidase FAD binding subunit
MDATGTSRGLEVMQGVVSGDRLRPAVLSDAVRGVMPSVVVEPVDAVELARVLKAADDRGLSVVPRGGGTKLLWGNRPRKVDLIVSTKRLAAVVEHAWADLTVTVEAGCTIRMLRETLAMHGQRIAADPLWPDTATVGGVLSTNDTGALRLRFGGWRDLVIGTTIALPDGTLARSGGKVVKNVAGYDLSKLATGALGTLGIITTAIFRVHPVPRVARTLSARPSDLTGAQRMMAALQDSRLAHTALQVRASSVEPPSVDTLFEGTAAGVDSQVAEARQIAVGAPAVELGPTVWSARQELWTGADGPIIKVSVPFSEIASTLEHVRLLADDAGASWMAVFQATGLGWIRFTGPRDWPALVRALRVKAPAGITLLRPCADDDGCETWGESGDALPLMAAVKRQFDPNGILNPGRFVGGI